jgi:archaellum component FlaC
MTNSPELKIDDKCSEKLQRIESEISKAKKDLENFKNAKNPELQSQIEELETKLKELEEEKQKIISETQSCLNLEKV